jgi:hypothetical protein
MGWIDLRCALPTQLELLLHRGVGRIAACHAAELEDALGIVGLAEGDPAGVLALFDAEVEAEEAEVADVERLLHLCLEHLHLLLFSTGDDEVVDVDADQ